MNVKQGSTTFLKVIIFLIGIAMLALCIYWLPEIAIKDAKVHPDTAYFLYPLFSMCIWILYYVFCCVVSSI